MNELQLSNDKLRNERKQLRKQVFSLQKQLNELRMLHSQHKTNDMNMKKSEYVIRNPYIIILGHSRYMQNEMSQEN